MSTPSSHPNSEASPNDAEAPSRDADPSSDAPADAPRPRRSLTQRVQRGLAYALGSVTLALGLVLLSLQFEPVSTATAQFLATTFNPLDGTEVSIGSVQGTWVSSLHLTDVALVRADPAGGPEQVMAGVDSVSARYQLSDLLYGTLHLTSVHLRRPSVTLRQAADSTWDWQRILPPASEDTSASSFVVRVDRAEIRDGAATAHFYTPEGDSTARIHDLQVRLPEFLSDASLGGLGVRVSLDTLGLRAQVPGSTDELRFSTRLDVSPTSLTLHRLQLTSTRSTVRGSGFARLPEGPNDPLDDVDLRLDASPLSFQDLAALLPTWGLDPSETLQGTLQLTGAGDELQTDLDASFQDGGSVRLVAAFTPRLTAPTTNRPVPMPRLGSSGAPSSAARPVSHSPGASSSSAHQTKHSDALRYTLDLAIDRLTTSLIGSTDPATHRLTTTLKADLRGPALDTLRGTMAFNADASRYAGFAADSARIQASMTNGQADLRFAGRINGAMLEGSGRTRPLDDVPTYRLTGQVGALDLSSFGVAGVSSSLNGDIDLNGRGATAEDLRTLLRVQLRPSRVNAMDLKAGNVRLRLRPDSAHGRLALTTGNGTAQLAGWAALDGSERFRLDTARVDDVRIAMLVDDTTQSRLQAVIEADGRGFDPARMRLDGRLQVLDSYYGTTHIDSVNTRVRLRAGTLVARLNAFVNEGQLGMEARGTPFAPVPDIQLREGRFRDIDIGRWIQDPTQTSALHGRFDGEIRGTSAQTLTARTSIRVDSSRINAVSLPSAVINLSMDEGLVRLTTSWTLNDATSRLRARARPFDALPSVEIEEGVLREMDLGALLNLPEVTTSLSGTLSGRIQGRDVSSLSGQARLDFDGSSINRASLTDTRLEVRADTGAVNLELNAALAGGSLTATGTASLQDRISRVFLRTQASALDLGALVGSDSIDARMDSLRWTFDGSGSTLGNLRAETMLATRGLRISEFNVRNIDVRGRLQDGQLQVDTLQARSNVFRATGGGTIAYQEGADAESDFRLRTDVLDVEPLAPLVEARTLTSGPITLEGRVYGAPGRVRFSAEGSLESLVYDDLRITDFRLRAAGRQGDNRIVERVELSSQVGFLSYGAVKVDEAQMAVVYDSLVADLTTTLRIDDRRQVALDATLDPQAARPRLTLRRVDAQLHTSTWQLLQEASITYGDAYRIHGLLLYSDDQQIAADGRIDPNGTQSLVATIEGFQVATVSDLVGFDGLGGRLDGTLSLSGSAQAPRLTVGLEMDVESEGASVGNLRLDATYDSLKLDVDAALQHVDGQTLTAGGTVPTDLRIAAATPVDVSSRPVDLALQTDAFPVDWIDPFLDPQLLQDARGMLRADVRVGGTVGTPDVSGTARLRDGRVTVPDLDVRYEQADADLSFSDDLIVIDRADVTDGGGGRLQGSGEISLAELTVGEYDLQLDAQNFTAIDTRAYSAVRVDGSLTVTGTTLNPVVRGGVTVMSGDIYYAETLSDTEAASLATVQLSGADERLLERRFGVRISEADTTTFDAYKALEMDLSVRIRRNTWLRSQANPELNIQFTGTLDLEKEPGEDAQVFGSIDVVPGRSTVRQFAQEFSIQEGVLTFNGDPTEPYLNFTAVYEKRDRSTSSTEVEITLTAQGRPEDLDLTLSSRPQMDTRNILSYLATGRPADQLLGGGESGTGDLAEELAVGQLTSLAENFATSNVGLDVVRIQYDSGGDSYFVLGRYVTPRFYVAIEQPVSTQTSANAQSSSSLAPDLTLEYELTDNLLMRAQSREQSLRFNLLFEYAY